jgi:hypothetical protein
MREKKGKGRLGILVEFDDRVVVYRCVFVRVHHEDYCVIQLIEIQRLL